LESSLEEKSSLYQLLVEAGAACGEAAGILDIAYLRRAHQRRQRIVEAAGSASLDGRPTTAERLFAWLGDVPIQAQANLGAEGYAGEVFIALGDDEPTLPLAREAAELADTARARVGRDPLAGAAHLFRGKDAITPASRVAYIMFLRRVLGPAEPALSPLFHGIEAAAKRPVGAFDNYMADRLARGSRRALTGARTLRAGVAAAYATLGKTRSSSHILPVVEQLFAGQPLTIASTSRIFSISRLAARKHLVRLERDGFAEAVGRGKTGVVYIARDGLMTFAQAGPAPAPKATSRLAVSTGKPLSPVERARLDAVTDDVASRMRDLDRLMARLAAANSAR
jgi:hypothetical protein